MNYNVQIENYGNIINEYTELSKKEAIEIAKKEANRSENSKYQIYVTWFRSSDGQKGYLNPNGDHDITGKAW